MRAALSEKQTRVFEAVVTSYISNGVPVGSKHVADAFNVGLRAASIRNLMAQLETLGLLMKPHTSAGRVPTQAGYRVYVDRVMKPASLKKREVKIIQNAMGRPLPLGNVLECISRALEMLSHQIGIALAPETRDCTIGGLEFAQVSSDTLVVTIRIRPGIVRTISVRVGGGRSLAAASNLLRKLVRGVVGRDIRGARHFVRDADLDVYEADGNLQELRRSVSNALAYDDYSTYVYGSANVLSQIRDTGATKALLRGLESKQAVARTILPDQNQVGVIVSIGSENRCKPMKSVSVVSSSYSVGNARGAIGVIGPLRMDYPRLVALVDYASRELTRYLAKEGVRESAKEG